MQQPMTEKTAIELTTAIRDLTAAIKEGGRRPQFNVSGDDMVSRSIVGGIEAAIAENKRNRTKTGRRVNR